MYWASHGDVGRPAPPEFTLIRVAQILNCSVFDLLDRPLRWRKLALLYERVEARSDFDPDVSVAGFGINGLGTAAAPLD